MTKSPDAFRTISEVAEWLGIQAHVLRFWESKFTQVKPVKRAGGRRYYRPADMQLLGGIKKLLHDDGLTIKGVQKILREQGVGHVSVLSQPLDESAADTVGDATVLPFAGSRQKARAARTRRRQADQIDMELTPAAETSQTAPEAAPEPDPVTAATPAPEAEPAVDPAAGSEPRPTPDAAALPSFLHRPATPPAPAAGTAAAGPRAAVIEAPDPPADDDMPYTSGVLAQVAKIDALSPTQASRIAPLVQELRGWLTQAQSAGTA